MYCTYFHILHLAQCSHAVFLIICCNLRKNVFRFSQHFIQFSTMQQFLHNSFMNDLHIECNNYVGMVYKREIQSANVLWINPCFRLFKKLYQDMHISPKLRILKTIKKTVDELFRKMQKYSPFIEVNFFMNWGNNLHSFTSIPAWKRRRKMDLNKQDVETYDIQASV